MLGATRGSHDTDDVSHFQALLALTLGSLIGLERQWHRRLVNLKTNALVCLGTPRPRPDS
jgi:uncharacterized membrane protein YhiD involved in acid resistance